MITNRMAAAALALALSIPAWGAALADDDGLLTTPDRTGRDGLLTTPDRMGRTDGPLLGDRDDRLDGRPLIERDGLATDDSDDMRRDQLYRNQEDLGSRRNGGILDDEGMDDD